MNTKDMLETIAVFIFFLICAIIIALAGSALLVKLTLIAGIIGTVIFLVLRVSSNIWSDKSCHL